MLALNHQQVPKPKQTINGKLIVQDPNHLEYINLQIESFTQQLEQIELQVVTAQQQDRREYINQVKMLKASVQNIEYLYKQLFSTSIITAVIFAILLLWLGVIRQPFCHKLQTNNPVITWHN